MIVYLVAVPNVGLKVLLILMVVMFDRIAGSTSSIIVVKGEYLKILSCFSKLSSDHVPIAAVMRLARFSDVFAVIVLLYLKLTVGMILVVSGSNITGVIDATL